MDERLHGKCGFYCAACPTYRGGGCRGCLDEHAEGDCFSRDCALKKDLPFCGACPSFPCETLLATPHATVLAPEWLRWKKESRTNR